MRYRVIDERCDQCPEPVEIDKKLLEPLTLDISLDVSKVILRLVGDGYLEVRIQ